MATNPRSPISERTDLRVVNNGRRPTQNKSNLLQRRLVSTAIALVLLALVLRYMPPGARRAQAQTTHGTFQADPRDLRFSDVQISFTPAGEVLYLDGLITDDGGAKVTGATAEVTFYDAQGQLIGSLQRPLVGVAHGGTDLVGNEFAKNPIQPGEMRFFRIAVEDIPPSWNHEVPALKIVAVKAQ